MYPDAMMWYEEYKGETKPDATPQPAWTTNSSANADTATSTPTTNTITWMIITLSYLMYFVKPWKEIKPTKLLYMVVIFEKASISKKTALVDNTAS